MREDRGDFMGGEPMPGRGGPKGDKSDEIIRDELCEQLTLDPYIDASDVIIKVKDGKVMLSGTVPDKWMKYSAEEVAENVYGVNEVNNNIRVAR